MGAAHWYARDKEEVVVLLYVHTAVRTAEVMHTGMLQPADGIPAAMFTVGAKSTTCAIERCSSVNLFNNISRTRWPMSTAMQFESRSGKSKNRDVLWATRRWC